MLQGEEEDIADEQEPTGEDLAGGDGVDTDHGEGDVEVIEGEQQNLQGKVTNNYRFIFFGHL